MSRNINLAKAELTEDEALYVSQRSWLQRARDEYFAQGNEPREDHELEDEDEDDGVSVREWLRTATASEIREELKERDVKYSASAKKAELGQLLIDAVEGTSEEEDFEEDEETETEVEATELSEDDDSQKD